MLSELEPYFAKYYDRWLDYSRYLCTRFGIRREAYDIMADVLVEFCCKKEEALSDLLASERQDGTKLFQYVRKAIRYRVIDFVNRKRVTLCDLEKHQFHLSVPVDGETEDEISVEEREAEAMFRDDSLMTPVAVSGDMKRFPKIRVVSYLDRRHAPGKGRLTVTYRTSIQMPGKKVKYIGRSTRSDVLTAVIRYQMQPLNQ